MKQQRLKLYNIKLSICYKKIQHQLTPGIYKIDNFYCTIYKTCQRRRLINVTGISHFHQIEHVKCKIETEFNLTICHVKIDNMFLARKCFLNFNIAKLISTCERLFKPTHFIIYDVLLFRGVYILPRHKQDPSFIVFRTGSLTLHCKRPSDIRKVENYCKYIYAVENLK